MAAKKKYLANYLSKRSLYPPLLKKEPPANLALIITIPCYNEINLLKTLHTLIQCELPDQQAVEVMVLINNAVDASKTVKDYNTQTFKEAKKWSAQNSSASLRFHILYLSDLPLKYAGVGLARKIAMDEGVRRFELLNRAEGVIACLDADSLVDSNYLKAICGFFEQNPSCQAANIYYEHPLEGEEYAENVYAAIIDYELHLRYYVHALQIAGLRMATQTVGSAMAVRAIDYAKEGGMNRRKAGEDFYFLHKFTRLKGFRTITTTTVIPSPRISDRVPFGTGKAVGDILKGIPFSTYHPLIFKDLKALLSNVGTLYSLETINAWMLDLPDAIQTFLKREEFLLKWEELKGNTSNLTTFQQRFFHWFDAFKAMKYVHFARDHFYPNLPVEKAVKKWLKAHSDLEIENWTAKDLLLYFRSLDRQKK